ncbi:SDR family oxidoreductase [Corynebacterium falsenii]|uniref:SDR family NAD(P)-dependent oxidoreductase n=1 Tax=Corynebacterium falsenii TaxID=108486 RepID=UPI001CCA747C|nr:glucose 1-dehydrogenase [Corynebacterium falsenii]UBI07025.1 SDR family oxidoreductase [Corynebacterium falsenii]
MSSTTPTTPTRLTGRTALITGSASGIGKAAAERLAAEGANIVVADVQDDLGEEFVKELETQGTKAIFVHHDVTSEDEWQKVVDRAVEEFGALDILVNNAGLADKHSIDDESFEEWQRTINVDLSGVFLGMKVAGPALKKSGHGSVINISSIFGTSGGFGSNPGYHASKGGVRTLTKNAALRWAQEGVRVNSVHPGFVETPFVKDLKGTPQDKWIIDNTPMGRYAQPEEVAAGIAFLASDDSTYVTGLELYIDGGFIAK